MCMLCVIPPNVIPSRDKLENSALNNPDGFGFAIVIPQENRIHVERTMNADESINRFLELRGKYPEGYATWHARYATHGTVDVENCHPFMVGSSHTYLAHNGIIPVLIEENKDKRSDTRIFAEDILARLGGAHALDNPQILNLLEDFTSGSKVVVLTLDPRAEQQCYLIHEDKGKVDESGVWWSNDSCDINYYASAYKSTSKYSHNWWNDDYVSTHGYMNTIVGDTGAQRKDYSCVMCQTVYYSYEMEKAEWLCPTCSTCQMCEYTKEACLCYRPKENNKITHIYEAQEMPAVMYDKVVKGLGNACYNFEYQMWEFIPHETTQLILPDKVREVPNVSKAWSTE